MRYDYMRACAYSQLKMEPACRLKWEIAYNIMISKENMPGREVPAGTTIYRLRQSVSTITCRPDCHSTGTSRGDSDSIAPITGDEYGHRQRQFRRAVSVIGKPAQRGNLGQLAATAPIRLKRAAELRDDDRCDLRAPVAVKINHTHRIQAAHGRADGRRLHADRQCAAV